MFAEVLYGILMKKKLILSIFIVMCSYFESISNAGTVFAQLSGYEILKTEVSARASALSGAFVGMTGDIHSLFYNPAGLIGIQNKTFGFTYLDYTLDFQAGNLIFAAPVGIHNKYALGVNFIDYGSFEGRDITGAQTAPFSAQDVVFAGGFAREYSSKIYYGVSGKVLYSKIADFNSTVVAFDGGIMYNIPEYMVTIGVSAANIGFVTSAFDKTKDDVPAVVKVGFTKSLAHLPLLISAEYRQLFDGEFRIVGGGEFTFTESIRGRFGYNSFGPDQKIGDEGGSFAGASFGFGFQWQKYVLDYAFNSFGVLGNLNRITFSVGM